MTFSTKFEAFLVVPSGVTISATNGGGSGGGPTSVSLTAGTYTPTSFVAHVVTRLNAVRTPANWTGSLSTTTGLVTLNTTDTPWSIAWTDTNVRDMLGFAADITSVSSAQTGTLSHRGLWLPDCPLDLEGDPVHTPVESDARSTEGPTGEVFTYCGNTKYVHKSLVLSHVALAKFRESVSSIKGSWEQWVKDTQLGLGHAWFTPGSAFQITNHDSIVVGGDLNSGAGPTNGWKASPAIARTSATKAAPPWTGSWRIEIPMIVSSG